MFFAPSEDCDRHGQETSAAVVQSETLPYPVETAYPDASTSMRAPLVADCDRATLSAAAVLLPLQCNGAKICSCRT